MGASKHVGDLLREWRQRRRLSQLELACDAEISTRHLSFMETGRAQPSREMILHLSEQMEIPMRERNVLLVAAGYAPIFPERSLEDPALQTVRKAIDLILEGQKPYPAFAIDRHWIIVASNQALPEIYEGIAPHLLQPPVNALRLTLHPEGLAPRVANLQEWHEHVAARLRRQIDVTADPVLIDLLREFSGYPGATLMSKEESPVSNACKLASTSDASRSRAMQQGRENLPEHAVVVPFRLNTVFGLLSFFTTTTVFGTPVDVTLSELAIESFYPADTATVEAVRAATTAGQIGAPSARIADVLQ
jgi:transcriptional regulator with XRE-family HTH domain